MGDLFEVQIVIKNNIGEFFGRKVIATEDKYNTIIEMVKTFYLSGGFELTCEDGSFVVFPPNLILNSILEVKKIRKDV